MRQDTEKRLIDTSISWEISSYSSLKHLQTFILRRFCNTGHYYLFLSYYLKSPNWHTFDILSWLDLYCSHFWEVSGTLLSSVTSYTIFVSYLLLPVRDFHRLISGNVLVIYFFQNSSTRYFYGQLLHLL